MPAPFIPDGYTREESIPETSAHPAVFITFRPMLSAERRRLSLQAVRLNARGAEGIDAAARLVVAALAARLVSWDLTDATGRLLEINSETLAALGPELFERIYEAITTFADEEVSAKN